MSQKLRWVYVRLQWMREMQAIVIDDPVAWAPVSLSLCHAGDFYYSFARWRHFDLAIIHYCIATCFLYTNPG